MRKHDFLEELLRRLAALPQTERDKAYAFYSEIIDDSIEDGMAEEETIAKLGSLDEIVERIVAEVPMRALLKDRVVRKPRAGGVGVWIALGFPVWFPVLISVAAVLVSLFVVLWVLALVLWVLFASGVASAAASIVGLMLYSGFGPKLMLAGAAMVFAGCAALLYPAARTVTERFAHGTRWVWTKMKHRLIKKGEQRNEE